MGTGTDISALLYPPPKASSTSKPSPNFYRPFQLLDNQFEARLKAVVEEEENRLTVAGGAGLNGKRGRKEGSRADRRTTRARVRPHQRSLL